MSHFAKSVIAAVAFVLLAFLGALAFGGEVVTTTPAQVEAREADGRVIMVDGRPLRFVDPEACYAYFRSQLAARGVVELDFQCVPGAIKGKVRGVCDDVPQPAPRDEFGFEVEPPLEHALCPGSDTRYQFTQMRLVEHPYPTCPRMEAHVVISCGPPPAAVTEYDDPADPPLERMALAPIPEPGTPVDFEGVLPPWESPDARP